MFGFDCGRVAVIAGVSMLVGYVAVKSTALGINIDSSSVGY